MNQVLPPGLRRNAPETNPMRVASGIAGIASARHARNGIGTGGAEVIAGAA